MAPLKLHNQKFGKLIVLDKAPKIPTRNGKTFGKTQWICKCDCGKIRVVDGSALTTGHTTSCGCNWSTAERRSEISVRNTSHGKSKTRIYSIWRHMIERCEKPNTENYARYGARGITVCERWHNFENFYEDMSSTYSDELTLDRRDVHGNYEPLNCRWATNAEQAQNTTKNRYYDYNGEKLCLMEIVRRKRLYSYATVHNRLKNGMTLDDALNKPLRGSVKFGQAG